MPRRSGVRVPRDVTIAAAVVSISTAGDMAAQAALTLRLHATTGSATSVSALLLANSIPVLLCVPLSGYLADRVDSRRLLAGSNLLCAVLCAALAAAGPQWLVLGLIACVAAVSAATAASLGALVPVMAGPAGVVRANTVLRGAVMVMSVAGLAVGGAGSQWLGTGPVLLVDAATFLTAALGAAVIRARRRGGRSGSARGTAASLEHQRPSAPAVERWTVAGSYALVLLLVSTTNVAQVFFVKDVLGASDLGFGLVSACWTVGTLLALPFVRRVRPDPGVLARLTIGGEVVTGVAILGCGVLAAVPVTAAMYVLGGVGSCVMQIARGSYLQLTAPEARRGRQLANYNAVVKAASIAALVLGGQLVELVGSRTTYLVAGAGAVIIAVGVGTFRRAHSSGRLLPLRPAPRAHSGT
ncbi:MAG TPA: MFS transporter [Pseudonocardia sp.]|nr:MFS transporter [Pseudonocardia sp.]